MKQIALVVASTLAVLMIFMLGTQFPNAGTAQSNGTTHTDDGFDRTITVTGVGVILSKPDTLKADIGVVSIQKSLDEALAENNSKMAAVIAALKALGINEKDIQTSQFNVSIERQDYNGPITGYHVTNTVHVTIRDLDQAGQILDEAVKAGANEIFGISFAISETEDLASQARQAAVADAKRKAEELVGAAGGRLGRVLTISTYNEPVYYGNAQFSSALRLEDAAVPLEGGELDLTMNVQVVFAIE